MAMRARIWTYFGSDNNHPVVENARQRLVCTAKRKEHRDEIARADISIRGQRNVP